MREPNVIWYQVPEPFVVVFTPPPDWRERLIAQIEAGMIEHVAEPEASMTVALEEYDA